MAQLKASTLVESTIALCIISIVFTIGWMTIGILIQSNQSIVKHKASIALEKIIDEHIKQENYIETTIEMKTFTVVQSLEASHWCTECIELHLKAYNYKNQLIAHKKRLIYAN